MGKERQREAAKRKELLTYYNQFALAKEE